MDTRAAVTMGEAEGGGTAATTTTRGDDGMATATKKLPRALLSPGPWGLSLQEWQRAVTEETAAVMTPLRCELDWARRDD